VDEKARTPTLAAPPPAYAVCAGNPFRCRSSPPRSLPGRAARQRAELRKTAGKGV